MKPLGEVEVGDVVSWVVPEDRWSRGVWPIVRGVAAEVRYNPRDDLYWVRVENDLCPLRSVAGLSGPGHCGSEAHLSGRRIRAVMRRWRKRFPTAEGTGGLSGISPATAPESPTTRMWPIPRDRGETGTLFPLVSDLFK